MSNSQNQRKKKMARQIVLGYPKQFVFQNSRDVRDYLNGDKIICLRCGKVYRALPEHLKVHNMSADEYRNIYGIPWTFALVGTTTKCKMRVHLAELQLPPGKPNIQIKSVFRRHKTLATINSIKAAIAKRFQ